MELQKQIAWVHRYATRENPENEDIFYAPDEDSAYKYLESLRYSYVRDGYIFSSLERKRGRGGRRPGAGAKPGNVPWNKRFDEPTKVARIPHSMDVESLHLKMQELQMLLSLWGEKIGDADDKKRVRYSKASELLKEVQFLLGDD